MVRVWHKQHEALKAACPRVRPSEAVRVMMRVRHQQSLSAASGIWLGLGCAQRILVQKSMRQPKGRVHQG
eukprot:1157975-Pelagomonas_calceolata.AAC.8